MFEPDFIESGTKEIIQTPRNAPIEAFDQICQSHNTSVVCNPLVWSKSTRKLVAKGVQSCMVYITGVLVEPADILYFKAFLFAVTKSLRTVRFINHNEQVRPEHWPENLRPCCCSAEGKIMIVSRPAPPGASHIQGHTSTNDHSESRTPSLLDAYSARRLLPTIPLGTSSAPWQQCQKRFIGNSTRNRP